MVRKNVFFKNYFYSRFNEISKVTIRMHLKNNKFNLTETIGALSNNHSLILLKKKRKTVFHPDQVNFKTTDNIEFLKEVKI